MARRLASCFALAAGLAFAQSLPLEIRGTVVEGPLGVAGATVTLYEFGHAPPQATTRTVFATVSTDSQGAFQFHPERVGNYYVEVRKEGYFAESSGGPTVDPADSTGDPVSIDADHPARERKFSMWRLGEVRGRVIDEDGNPIAKLNVALQAPSSSPLRGFARAVTDQDGYFAAAKLRPGDYMVRIGPQRGLPEILPQFSEGDLKIVDQDLETSFWPGGGDERSALPLPLSSGASLNVGTITARKSFYYRAHLSVQSGDCAPGEKLNFSVASTADTSGIAFPLPVPCGKEFLVRNLAPGSYLFSLSTGRPLPEKRLSATALVDVTNANLELALIMAEDADISGRLLAADGATSAPGRAMITVTPVVAPAFQGQRTAADPAGKFLFRGVLGNRYRVSVDASTSRKFATTAWSPWMASSCRLPVLPHNWTS